MYMSETVGRLLTGRFVPIAAAGAAGATLGVVTRALGPESGMYAISLLAALLVAVAQQTLP